jgi:hypothetical protein
MFSETLGKSKILNREGRKEIAKDAKKNYECSGAFREESGGRQNLKTQRTRRTAAQDAEKPGLLLLVSPLVRFLFPRLFLQIS